MARESTISMSCACMTIALRQSGLFLLSCMLTTVASTELKQEYVDSSLTYFERYLSDWPPKVEDSLHEQQLQEKLTGFIQQIEENETAFNAFRFNYILGQLYYFGFNLDLDSAWKKCERHFLKAIDLEPDSVMPKLILSALYGNSFNPMDTSSFKRAYYSVNMLSELRKDGKDVEYPTINLNLCLAALTLGIQSLCFDAGYEYWKQMPKDSSAEIFKGLFGFQKKGCSLLSAEKGRKEYFNGCFGFKVSYPDTLILYLESTDTSIEHMAKLNLALPLVMNSERAQIRNAVSVSAWDSNYNDLDAKVGGIIRRFAGAEMMPRNVQLQHLRSSYEYVLGKGSEAFHTVLTLLQTDKHLYALMYVATNSTFDKNLGYYQDFEKNFIILANKETASPSIVTPEKKTRHGRHKKASPRND